MIYTKEIKYFKNYINDHSAHADMSHGYLNTDFDPDARVMSAFSS